MQASGIRAQGPLPADTVFVPQVLAGFDAVLAMYHDQGCRSSSMQASSTRST